MKTHIVCCRLDKNQITMIYDTYGCFSPLDCIKITPRVVYKYCDSLQGGLTDVSTKEKNY